LQKIKNVQIVQKMKQHFLDSSINLLFSNFSANFSHELITHAEGGFAKRSFCPL
jgi:hypothetical protein